MTLILDRKHDVINEQLKLPTDKKKYTALRVVEGLSFFFNIERLKLDFANRQKTKIILSLITNVRKNKTRESKTLAVWHRRLNSFGGRV